MSPPPLALRCSPNKTCRGVARTVQGQICFEAMAPALDALEDAAPCAKVPLESNEFRWSINPTLASHWLTPRSPDFHRSLASVAFRNWLMAQGQAHEQQPSALGPKP